MRRHEKLRTSVDQEAPNTESFEDIDCPRSMIENQRRYRFRRNRTKTLLPPTSDIALSSEETKDVVAPQLPHDTTTIVKGNVNVAAVTASANQAAEIHAELTALSYNEAITPNESVIDEQGLTTKISEVKDDLDSNETLSVILLKCIDIARSLNRRADLKWIHVSFLAQLNGMMRFIST